MEIYPFNGICPCHGELVEPNGGFKFEWVKEMKLPFDPIDKGHIVVVLRAASLNDWIICSLGE